MKFELMANLKIIYMIALIFPPLKSQKSADICKVRMKKPHCLTTWQYHEWKKIIFHTVKNFMEGNRNPEKKKQQQQKPLLLGKYCN